MITAETIDHPEQMPAFAIALAATALAVCYGAVVAELVHAWSIDPLYSYGFAVPLISAYIVANRWAAFRVAFDSPDYVLGSLSVMAAALMLIVGQISTALRLQELSLVVMAAGAALLLFGRAAFRQIWFAIAYLLLMVPVWTNLISRLQVPSQLVSGRIAVAFFHLIRMPAVQEGTLIYLPHITLEVLRECSGVNQLIAVFSITLPAAYLWINGWWRKAGFVLASLLIAYATNGARIALIGILASNGFDTKSPNIHLAEGLAVAALGYGLIAVLFSLFARFESSNHTPPPSALQTRRNLSRCSYLDATLFTFVLATGAICLGLARFALEVPLKSDLLSLPYTIGDWSREGTWTPSELESTIADDATRLTYKHVSGKVVRLYVGYQRRQVAAKGLGVALPKFPRGTAAVIRAPLSPYLQEVNEVVQRFETHGSDALYWFVVGEVPVARALDAKIQLVRNAVTNWQTNGAVIVVSWDTPNDLPGDSSRQLALNFIRSLITVLPKYLPSRS